LQRDIKVSEYAKCGSVGSKPQVEQKKAPDVACTNEFNQVETQDCRAGEK